MIWFISDTHYHHKNIVRGTSQWSDKSGCRPFNTLEAHDDWLVETINKKVAGNDTLYHLGDWSFGGKDRVVEFWERLICNNIHLVTGNHDQWAKQNPDGIFRSVSPYVELGTSKVQLVLMHYPIESWNNMERGSIHLHGHVHNGGRKIDGRYDVGVDGVGLVSLDEVALWSKATIQRHSTIEGGNKFG